MKYQQLVSMPSAVSDWLEEQLEARGIDAVVYTRYILSLLHSDTVDVIYSDEDLHFSHLKKEVRRSGGSRKRFRRSSDWWRHAQADAEKLKRSAAVECLMSASEQTCGIESLIDELCEKLNEIKSDVTSTPASPTKKSSTTNQDYLKHASPQELANRYYAAFPPLTRTSSPTRLISLIPKWIPSPSKKKPARKSRVPEDAMKASRIAGRQRFGAYIKTNKKEVAFKDGWSSAKKLRAAEVVPTQDESDRWVPEDEANMYDDLPVDIKDLLDDTPMTHECSVEMMNLANMRDTGKRDFIRSGTNITSSIWSNDAPMKDDARIGFDNSYNAALAASGTVLDIQFSSININNRSDWTSQGKYMFMENECNSFFESNNNNNNNNDIWNYGVQISDEWKSEETLSEEYKKFLFESFDKLNHTTEESAFRELKPNPSAKLFNPFNRVLSAEIHRVDISLIKTVDLDKEKDDLLTSIHSHFRPINQKNEKLTQGEYADGATFTISNNWDHINYKRTESGALYMENDFAMRKRYCEYKLSNSPTSVDFILKYLVSQNDKACQTDELDAEVEAATLPQRLRDERRAAERRRQRCTCHQTTTAMNTDYAVTECPVHDIKTTTTVKKTEQKALECDKCNSNKTVWDTNVIGSFKCDDEEWGGESLRNIWSGADVCLTCLGRPPSTLQHSKLRQDISQDGDQLLSDLSTIQKCYMEELPASEFSCDISEILLANKERKRRHSLMNPQSDEAWSFASRLEEDCLIQMSTIPTLRSVTL